MPTFIIYCIYITVTWTDTEISQMNKKTKNCVCSSGVVYYVRPHFEEGSGLVSIVRICGDAVKPE